MPSNPQILKEVIFTLDTEDFAPDIVDGRVGFTPGAIQTIKTLDGVVHQDAESGDHEAQHGRALEPYS